MSFIGVAAGAGVLGAGARLFSGAHQNHLANKIQVPEADYEKSPYAAKMLAEASMLKNSRMPGAAAAEQHIDANGANAFAGVERNATSGSQALATLAGINGNTDSAIDGLSANEANYHLNTVNNWNNALSTNINEGDKEYQDDVRKRNEAIQQKNALRGAATQNIGGGFNDLQNNAFLLSMLKQGKKE